MRVIVYGKPHCVMCHYTLVQLDKLIADGADLTYEEIDVTTDRDAANDVREMGFGDHPQLPIVVASNAQRTVKWSGFNLDKIRGLKFNTGNY